VYVLDNMHGIVSRETFLYVVSLLTT